MKTSDLDKIFDEGQTDMNDFLDRSRASRPGQEQERVKVDSPVWMVERVDREANRLGVARQSLIKVLIWEHVARQTPKGKRKANQTP